MWESLSARLKRENNTIFHFYMRARSRGVGAHGLIEEYRGTPRLPLISTELPVIIKAL